MSISMDLLLGGHPSPQPCNPTWMETSSKALISIYQSLITQASPSLVIQARKNQLPKI